MDREPYLPLLWRAAAVQLGFAMQILIEPGLFGSPAYAPVHGALTAVAVLFLVAGGLALFALTGYVPPRLIPVVLVVAAVPLAPLAYGFLLTGVVTGSVGWSVEVVVLLYTAWALTTARAMRLRPYILMVGAMQLLQGIGMLVAPAQFQDHRNYAEFGSYLWLFAPTFILAGAGILIAEARRWERPLLGFALLAAVNLSVLVNVFAVTRIWTGVLSYGVMGLVLLVAVSRRPAAREAAVLLMGIGGMVAVWDLISWAMPLAGIEPLVPVWTLMRPSIAGAVLLLVVGFPILLRGADRPRRWLGGIAGVLAAAIGAASAAANVLQSGGSPDVVALFGDRGVVLDWAGAPAAAIVASAGGVILVVFAARPRSVIVPHLVAAFATAAFGLAVLDLLAYMLDSPVLLRVVDVAAMRVHAVIAVLVLSVGLIVWSLSRIAQSRIGERVFAGLYVLMIVALIRSMVADGALAELVRQDPADPVSQTIIARTADARNVLLALGLISMAWTGMLITRTVTHPLDRLARAIQRARAGEPRVQVGAASQDEIGDVIRAFDRMTVEVADTNEALTARTKDLERLNDRYRTMLQAQSDLGEAVVLLDGGEPTEWNEALSRITGRSDAELRALGSPFELVAPERRKEIEQLVRARSRETYRVEFPMVRPDGEAVDVEVAIIPVADGMDRQMAIVRDVTDRNRAQRKLERLALHDDLTGLSNRTLFVDRAERTIRAAARSHDRFGIVYLDLDRFKQVNDAYGHASGDRLLREVGSRLLSAVDAADTVARFGGDEFAILHPASGDIGALVMVADRIAEALRAPFATDGHPVYTDASIGLVSYPDHGTDVDTLLRHADVAMYSAKRSARPWSVYAIDDDPRSQQRLTMLADLRQALERGELDMHFQPKVTLTGTAACSSVEALVRWRHPRLGDVPPKEFIPLAEETGLIDDLGWWILREALRRCAQWRAVGSTASVAVNFSMRSLRDPEIARSVLRTLSAAGLPPSALIAEVTESWMMLEPRRTEEVLTHLAGAGVRISIDDFGTGYSSLVYLQRLPVHELKIDAGFVGAMLQDPGSEAIVRSTIELGHALQLQVVAEGVEDAATMDALAVRHCDCVQGYAIARPMPFEDLCRWLRAPASRPAPLRLAGAAR